MQIRNIGIIAHVDHGKTTLVDKMLQQSGLFRDNEKVAERVMDSFDLERERGITILAKVASLMWNGVRVNVVDTPGHADFGGEVERIMHMVDGVVLLVDAAEGPMPQTKFVVSKALALGLRPIVVINKVDKPDARPDDVVNEVFDLFAALDATNEQLDFPILYGSAKQGWMSDTPTPPELEEGVKGLEPLFNCILTHVPPPAVTEGDFRMLGTILESNPYVGRLITGRIASGTVRTNQPVKVLNSMGQLVEQGRISSILAFQGLQRVPVSEAHAGDIVALSGFEKGTVADTFCDVAVADPVPATPIDPPTVSMAFLVNDSPLAGTEGDKVTSRVIRDRLLREAEGNIALHIADSPDSNAFEVSGRGELQLAILIETMRREGFELGVSRPRVVFKADDQGRTQEPVEEVIIDVDEEHSGIVVQKLSARKGDLVDMRPSGGGRTRLVFHIPTRGLIGYHSELLTDTRGTAILNRLFHSYTPYKGSIPGRHTGALISNGAGEAVAYALWYLEDRGSLMLEPGTKVYEGMIVGEHTRGNDLEVNVLKGKKLTNIRTTSKDEAVRLMPPRLLTLEQALSWIEEDELVEVTPKSIRLRKRILDPNQRKRAEKQQKALDSVSGSSLEDENIT